MTRVAAVQATPVFLDGDATIAKACRLIEEAAASGARLIVFPESFVPGYPDWVWVVPAGQGKLLSRLHGRFLSASVAVPSDSTKRLADAARRAKAIVAIGVSERNAETSSATMYNTLLLFDANGDLIGRHRKLIPTGGERLVWAQGDASGLRVHDTGIGRIGGLICWENYMPLARYALYTGGVQIYLAPTWDHGEGWMATLRHIAREARAFVIGCSIVIRRSDFDPGLEFPASYPQREWINPGGSAIVDPKGNALAGPVNEREEILLADIDIEAARGAKWDLDTAGHYARPDIFELTIDREPRSMLREASLERPATMAPNAVPRRRNRR
ncbi:MAG: carbon-nitrogen hydrolase family protein [Thermoanaerobaculia bacterium]